MFLCNEAKQNTIRKIIDNIFIWAYDQSINSKIPKNEKIVKKTRNDS